MNKCTFNKCLAFLLLIFVLGDKLQAQVKVYLSHQAPPYVNPFQGLKQVVQIGYSLRDALRLYPFQVGISYNKYGIEFGRETLSIGYNKWGNWESYTPGTILNLNFNNRTVLFTYTAFKNKYISIVPKLGAVHTDYRLRTFEAGNKTETGEIWEVIFGGEAESRWGIMSGVHVNANLFKGLYATTNIRYAYYPFASYNHMNLSVGVGLGFTFTVKKAKGK